MLHTIAVLPALVAKQPRNLAASRKVPRPFELRQIVFGGRAGADVDKGRDGFAVQRLEQGFHTIFADLRWMLGQGRGFGACSDGGELCGRAVEAHDEDFRRVQPRIAEGLNGPGGRLATGRRDRGAVGNPLQMLSVASAMRDGCGRRPLT